jgi:hypothetical protein
LTTKQFFTQWIASLDHETFDATMENVVVKVPVFAMNTEIFDGFRTFFAK